MNILMTDAPLPAPPFLLDRDLLNDDLELARAKGFECPDCAQTMEWDLGPKTRGEILDALAQGNVHEKLVFCDKDNCKSVERQEDGSLLVTPFVRRISSDNDGTINIKTLSLDDFIKDAAHLRQLGKVAMIEKIAQESAHRQEIEDLRRDFAQQLADTRNEGRLARASARGEMERANKVSETLGERNTLLAQAQKELEALTADLETRGRELSKARQEIDALAACLRGIDRILGVTNPENRLAVIQDFIRDRQRLAEIQRLTGQTTEDLLVKAQEWVGKRRR